MKISFTGNFIREYGKLPHHIRKTTDKRLGLLLSNPRHPPLNIKKMNDPRNIWEGRITESYCFTFQIEDDICILRKIGAHDMLRKP